jgi:hypothetical protein
MRVTRSHRGVVIPVVALLVAMAAATTHGAVLGILDDPRFEPGAEFGRALAAVGANVAVGAPGGQVFDQQRAGRVQIFGRGGALLQSLNALTPVAGAEFGTAIVESDGLLFITAPGDQPVGVGGTGSVYVFDATTGVPVRVVRAPDPDAGTAPVGGTNTGAGPAQSTAPRPVAHGFGHALAVTASAIIVGAPDSTIDGVAGAGAVYVFGRDGTLIRTLQEIPARAGAFFGAWVAPIGDALFVGVPGAPAGTVAGAGIVREFDLVTGSPRTMFSPPISTTGAEFGTVIGEVGTNLFVSAPSDSTFGPVGLGTVYLFDARTLAFRRSVTPPITAPLLDFGRAVVTLGGDLLVGADGAGQDASGEAFLIDPTTSAVVTLFTPTIERPGGRFGFALALAGPVIAIGEPAIGSSSTVGRVWLFDPAGSSTTLGPRPPRSPAGEPPPAAAPCPATPTDGSIRCRVMVLLAAVQAPNLERPLRRTLRALHGATNARRRARVRALHRATLGVQEFATRLRAVGTPPADRAALLAVSDGVSADLGTLTATAAE